jgi:hypothetical protein
MSNIQVVNLADNINAAILKINQNFAEVDLSKLSEAEVNALIQAALADFDVGLDADAVRAVIEGANLDMGSNKIFYSNVFQNESDLPSASSYHGMFAHVHNTGAAYFAHAGQWVKLANAGDAGAGSLDDLSDVQLTSNVLIGHVLKWDGTKWTNLEDSTGGGGDPSDPSENGTSFYQATIYRRATSQPTTPSGGTFDFPSATLTPPSDWEGTIPDGSDDLWACNFLFRDYLSQQGTITATDWSEPYRLAGLIDVNSNGESYAQVSIYRRWSAPANGSEPVLLSPTGGSFDFDPSVNLPLTAPSEWYLTPPSEEVQTGDLYVSSGIATTNGLAEGVTLDQSISWTQPLKTNTGTDGQDGRSIFEKAVYRRVQKPDGWSVGDALPVPPKPVGGFFNFGEEIFGKTAPDTPGPLDDAANNTGVWYAGVPTWDPTSGEPAGDVWSSVYAFSVVGDTGTSVAVDENWSEPTIGILDSVSTYRKSLYARSINRPTTDFTGNSVIYDFTADKFLTINAGTDAIAGIDGDTAWYEEPPELDLNDPMDLWEVSTTASMIGYLGQDKNLTFGDIKLVLNYAIDAEDGFSFVQLNAYKWSATNPGTPPSDGTFNFNSKTFVVPTDWDRNVTENNDASKTLYVSSGVASTKGLTEADNNIDSDIEWSTADATTAGGSGRDGRSTFRAVIVKRTNDVPVINGGTLVPPTGGVVNFAGISKTVSSQELTGANVGNITTFPPNSVTPPVGWYDHVSDIPTGEVPDGKIWAVEQTFAIDGDDSIDIGGEWSAPYEDHNNGEDGYSTFSASVYKRSADKPPADSNGKWGPVGATYNFSTDLIPVESLSGGWSEEPQASNAAKDPLWMCRATATTQGLTGEDLSLTWSEPVKVSTDGEDGLPGSGIVVDLTNENHSITAQNDGTLYSTSLLGAFTTLQAFDGDDIIDLSNETVNISISTPDLLKGTGVNRVNWITNGLVTTITHVGKNVDEFTLAFSVLGKSTTFTLTKVKAGADGIPPTVYRLVTSANVIKANPNNTQHTPSTITASVIKYVGGFMPVGQPDGEATLKVKINNSTSYASTSDTGTLLVTVADGTEEVSFELYVSDVMVDEETIPVVFDGTDSGDITVPPRMETGYVYYTVAQDANPGAPSATQFNFLGTSSSGTDGNFTGLSPTGWSINPPQGTNLNGTFWAARFSAFEDSSGSGVATNDSGNLHFSTPFKNYSFNGLVTFQNLDGSLIEAGTTPTTLIDGGLIHTGTVVADSIRATALTAITAQIQEDLVITTEATSIDTTDAIGYDSAGERMVITGENIRIYDVNSTSETTGLRVKLGKLT